MIEDFIVFLQAYILFVETLVLPIGTNVLPKKSNAHLRGYQCLCAFMQNLVYSMHHDNTDVNK